jgi:hypothetical protein
MKEATLKDKYSQVVVQSKRSERRTTEPLGVTDVSTRHTIRRPSNHQGCRPDSRPAQTLAT